MWEAYKRSTNLFSGSLPALVASKQIVEPTPPMAPKPALQLTARGRVREVASGHMVYETDSSVPGSSSAATGSSGPLSAATGSSAHLPDMVMKSKNGQELQLTARGRVREVASGHIVYETDSSVPGSSGADTSSNSSPPHSAATDSSARLAGMIMKSRNGPSSDVGSGEKHPDGIFPNLAGNASSDGCKPLDNVLQPHPPLPSETGEDDESSCQDGRGRVKYVMCRRNRTERIVRFVEKKIDDNPLHMNMEEVFLPRWMGPSLQKRVLRDLQAYQDQARAKIAKAGIAEPPHKIQEPPPRG